MVPRRRVDIVNLTGHNLAIGTPTDQRTFKSSGRVRLDTRYGEVETIQLDGGIEIPVLELLNGDYSVLPPKKERTLYVVSGLVAGRAKRDDILAPARLHRENGKVMYARALLRYR